nr:MAG TPA: hypothetical protein [Caudoviricetes sp.]
MIFVIFIGDCLRPEQAMTSINHRLTNIYCFGNQPVHSFSVIRQLVRLAYRLGFTRHSCTLSFKRKCKILLQRRFGPGNNLVQHIISQVFIWHHLKRFGSQQAAGHFLQQRHIRRAKRVARL